MQTIQRNPVVLSALIVALVQAGIIMARQMGWWVLTDEQFAAVMAFVAAFIALGSFVLRRYTTPMSDPRDDNGAPLVPKDNWE